MCSSGWVGTWGWLALAMASSSRQWNRARCGISTLSARRGLAHVRPSGSEIEGVGSGPAPLCCRVRPRHAQLHLAAPGPWSAPPKPVWLDILGEFPAGERIRSIEDCGEESQTCRGLLLFAGDGAALDTSRERSSVVSPCAAAGQAPRASFLGACPLSEFPSCVWHPPAKEIATGNGCAVAVMWRTTAVRRRSGTEEDERRLQSPKFGYTKCAGAPLTMAQVMDKLRAEMSNASRAN